VSRSAVLAGFLLLVLLAATGMLYYRLIFGLAVGAVSYVVTRRYAA